MMIQLFDLQLHLQTIDNKLTSSLSISTISLGMHSIVSCVVRSGMIDKVFRIGGEFVFQHFLLPFESRHMNPLLLQGIRNLLFERYQNPTIVWILKRQYFHCVAMRLLQMVIPSLDNAMYLITNRTVLGTNVMFSTFYSDR